MLKRKTKLFSFILAMCIILSILAGCGSTKEEDVTSKNETNSNISNEQSSHNTEGTEENTSSEEDPYAKYAPIEGKKYTIEWTCGLNEPVAENAERIKYWNEKFNVELNIWDIQSDNYTEVFNLRLAAGEIPDKICVMGGLGNLYQYQEQDVLLQIPEEVLKRYAPDMYTKVEKELPGTYDSGKIDGKLYGLPLLSRDNVFRSPLVVRGDWLENVGIDKLPETLEEFEEMVYKFTKEDPDRDGQNDTYGLSESTFNAIYGAFGYIPEYWQERAGKLVYGAVQPETKEALRVLSKWYKDGVIDPEFITGENQGGYWAISHSFVNDRIGVSGHGYYYHWKPASFEGDEEIGTFGEFKKTHTKEQLDKLTFILPPKGPEGKFGTTQGNLTGWAFNAFGKHLEEEPDKVGKILEILNWTTISVENYLTSYYGIKGVDWDYTPDGGIKRSDTSGSLLKGHLILAATTPPSISFATNPGRQEFAKERQLDIGGIRNELTVNLPSSSKYITELNKIQEEAFLAIITGDKPIDYFDEFVEKWRKAGGAQLEKEANEWYATVKK